MAGKGRPGRIVAGRAKPAASGLGRACIPSPMFHSLACVKPAKGDLMPEPEPEQPEPFDVCPPDKPVHPTRDAVNVREKLEAVQPLIYGLPLAAYGLPMPPPRVPTIQGQKGKGGKGGRAPFKPSDEQRAAVYQYAAVGVPQEIIGKLLGFSLDTLEKYFRDELDMAGPDATARVAGTLWKKAMDGDTASAIFWMKTRGGWRDVSRTEITGPDGRPIQTQSQVVHLDTSALDVEARDALQQALLAARGDIIDTDATDVE